jgi:acetate kinase
VAPQGHARLQGIIAGLGANPAFAAYDQSGRQLDGRLPPGATRHDSALAWLIDWLQAHLDGPLAAAGHRVVHGGDHFAEPVLITADNCATLETLIPLAPLHQPHNLAGVRAAMRAFPQASQVACFDTAFHRTMPPVHQRFALPRALHDAGVLRHRVSSHAGCTRTTVRAAARDHRQRGKTLWLSRFVVRVHRRRTAAVPRCARARPRHRCASGQRREPVRDA